MSETKPAQVLTAEHLQALFEALTRRRYRLLGPVVRDGAIVYDDIATADQLPRGWSDRQDGGTYRLVRREDGAFFGFASAANSWKSFLHRPRQRLWQADIRDGEASVNEEPEPDERLALIGVRACDLQAIAILDRVLLGGAHADPWYRARRNGAFVVALNCSHAGATCFCVSMGTGPCATGSFDLALTEIAGGGPHRFVVTAGSAAGSEVLDEVPAAAATPADLAAADTVVARTAASMGRELPAEEVHDLLLDHLDHPRWDDVADRCLSCGNCTLACPTCFCTSTEDASSLDGRTASRSQRWDSCFTLDFSWIHGGSVRSSPRARYRQWMSHKLATWHDQFGTSGCVGCGRCITWCPVGIDITEEVRAIGESARGRKERS